MISPTVSFIDTFRAGKQRLVGDAHREANSRVFYNHKRYQESLNNLDAFDFSSRIDYLTWFDFAINFFYSPLSSI
jgi:hypothetical protein